MAKISSFQGNYTGLTAQEAHQKQQQFGFNEIVPQKKDSFLRKIIHVLSEPMLLLLLGTATLYFVLGEPGDGAIMIGFVIFMSSISLFQQWRTDKTLSALQTLSAPRVHVLRDQEMVMIESRQVCVGDIVYIEEGQRISADADILEMADLGVDESTLTGESDVVWKTLSDTTQNHWRRDRLYAGTAVVQGSVVARVSQIGTQTQYGMIGKDIIEAPDRPTPLEKQTKKLVKTCALIGMGLFVLVVLISYIVSHNVSNLWERISHAVLAGVTLAMAILPEEFPVILTVFLAMGAWRLARKEALIRRMPAVETLGAVTVLCVDKTGTLTQNQMTVEEIYCHQAITKDQLISAMVLACEAQPYDPMEKAMLEYGQNQGLQVQTMLAVPPVFEYAFSSQTKRMGHVVNDQGLHLYAKGSPESILSLCTLTTEETQQAEKMQRDFAKQGCRVIAVASRRQMQSIPATLEENAMQFLGLIALTDPPRPGVDKAIETCHRAGMRVVMITGDNGTTAEAIGNAIGLASPLHIMTGDELDALSDDQLQEKVRHVDIFARVIPSHKMRIVLALKAIGEVVAMTGDGVNDAPALKRADIGIAMGMRGTPVAREAADMVLLDDNFTTIVDTVKDGRRIYDNIKKSVGYVMLIHIPIVLLALLTPLLGLPLMLLPVHVVLLELIVDPTCSIIFERLPAEKNVMSRKPRHPKAPLISRGILLQSLLQGLIIFLGSFVTYALAIKQFHLAENIARSMGLTILVLCGLCVVVTNQSHTQSCFAFLRCLRDKVVLSISGGIALILCLLLFTYPGNTLAKTAPLTLIQILLCMGIAGVSTLWWEWVKLYRRKRKNG